MVLCSKQLLRLKKQKVEDKLPESDITFTCVSDLCFSLRTNAEELLSRCHFPLTTFPTGSSWTPVVGKCLVVAHHMAIADPCCCTSAVK